jgi:dihydroxyacid dehydratase/phosphogluconate dehydratase
MGGLRAGDVQPVALGYHTGHWEIGLLVRAAAETLREEGVLPFAAYCSDPCDGRTQGTAEMYDSLAYRNDAAITMRRLIRSLPRRAGVMGIATCDKGLPATLLALAGCRDVPGMVVPGGVTLPAIDGEDAGRVQSIGKLRDGDIVEIVIDRHQLTGDVNFVGVRDREQDPESERRLESAEAARVLAGRTAHAGLRAAEGLPDDTRLWAALQQASGGTWGGCVYDVDRIVATLEAGAASEQRAARGRMGIAGV